MRPCCWPACALDLRTHVVYKQYRTLDLRTHVYKQYRTPAAGPHLTCATHVVYYIQAVPYASVSCTILTLWRTRRITNATRFALKRVIHALRRRQAAIEEGDRGHAEVAVPCASWPLCIACFAAFVCGARACWFFCWQTRHVFVFAGGLIRCCNVGSLGLPPTLCSHSCGRRRYRESKLTQLLRSALGGDARTLVIASGWVSPPYIISQKTQKNKQKSKESAHGIVSLFHTTNGAWGAGRDEPGSRGT